MQLPLHATRRTHHGASRLAHEMSAWSVNTRHVSSRYCKDVRVHGHTTAMRKIKCFLLTSTPPTHTPQLRPPATRHHRPLTVLGAGSTVLAVPLPFFAVFPLVILSSTMCHSPVRTVYDGLRVRLFQNHGAAERIMPPPDPREHNASVEAYIISTPLSGTAFGKTPSLLSRLPSSRRTRP